MKAWGCLTVWVAWAGLGWMACESGGTDPDIDPSACRMCTTIAAKCGWGTPDQEKCLRTCQASLEHPAKCQSQYDAALSCFNQESSWSCTSSSGLVGCQAQMTAYDACRIGKWVAITDLPKSIRVLKQAEGEPGTLIAGTGSFGSGCGVFRSSDGGKSWASIKAGLPNFDATALAISRSNPAVIVAVINRVLYRSENGGQSWKAQNSEPITPSRDIVKLAMASDDGLRLYALAEEDGFFRSEDGGKTWVNSNTGLPVQDYGSFQVLEAQTFDFDPAQPNLIYLGTGAPHSGSGLNGVYKSSDGGKTWAPANKGIMQVSIPALKVVDSQHVYAATEESFNGMVYESTDGGSNWGWIYGESESSSGPYSTPVDIQVLPGFPGKPYLITRQLDLIVRSQIAWTTLVRKPSGGVPGAPSDRVSLVVVSENPLVVVTGADQDGAFRYASE